jgi:hypothetical protein
VRRTAAAAATTISIVDHKMTSMSMNMPQLPPSGEQRGYCQAATSGVASSC